MSPFTNGDFAFVRRSSADQFLRRVVFGFLMMTLVVVVVGDAFCVALGWRPDLRRGAISPVCSGDRVGICVGDLCSWALARDSSSWVSRSAVSSFVGRFLFVNDWSTGEVSLVGESSQAELDCFISGEEILSDGSGLRSDRIPGEDPCGRTCNSDGKGDKPEGCELAGGASAITASFLFAIVEGGFALLFH